MKLFDQIIDSPKFKSKLLVRSNQLRKRAEELEKKIKRRKEVAIDGKKPSGRDPVLLAHDQAAASGENGPNILRQSRHKKQIYNYRRFIKTELQLPIPSENTQNLLLSMKTAQTPDISLGIHGVGKHQSIFSLPEKPQPAITNKR